MSIVDIYYNFFSQINQVFITTRDKYTAVYYSLLIRTLLNHCNMISLTTIYCLKNVSKSDVLFYTSNYSPARKIIAKYDNGSIASALLIVFVESPPVFGEEERSMNPSFFTKFQSSPKQSALYSLRLVVNCQVR